MMPDQAIAPDLRQFSDRNFLIRLNTVFITAFLHTQASADDAGSGKIYWRSKNYSNLQCIPNRAIWHRCRAQRDIGKCSMIVYQYFHDHEGLATSYNR